ncbi:S41 family peptidase [Nonomuraea wenchangensis]|uniref:S41 family peptidase n=1 Tax=Nonomuraea wenchangensis TaxID=568860 RepID=UPI0034254092
MIFIKVSNTLPHVLSNDSTFSAAEELAHDLQQLGRAVVVGEPTRGGVYPRLSVGVPPRRSPNARDTGVTCSSASTPEHPGLFCVRGRSCGSYGLTQSHPRKLQDHRDACRT